MLSLHFIDSIKFHFYTAGLVNALDEKSWTGQEMCIDCELWHLFLKLLKRTFTIKQGCP